MATSHTSSPAFARPTPGTVPLMGALVRSLALPRQDPHSHTRTT